MSSFSASKRIRLLATPILRNIAARTLSSTTYVCLTLQYLTLKEILVTVNRVSDFNKSIITIN